MNDVLLIKNNISTEPDVIQKVTFAIHGLDGIGKVNEVLDAIFHQDFEQIENVILKYNGVDIEMHTAKIPQMIRHLSDHGIEIYGVHVLYDTN